MEGSVRIDKWLWAVRLFKTRSMATEACKKGRIIIDKVQVKPSRVLKVGDVVQIRKSPVTYSFKVLGIIEKRVNAKIAAENVKDITPSEELKILDMQKHMLGIHRDPGTGRPTKKERRDLDDFFEVDYDFESDW